MQWYGLHLVDWIVLAVYLVGIVIIGTWSYRRVKNMEDFFMGGRRFGKVFMMFFAFGAGTSSEQAVSVASGSFRFGLAGIWYQFLWLWATPFYWIIAPTFRRMRALTTSDFFEARYDTSTATLYSCFGIMMSIVFIGAALFGSGQMIEGLTDGGMQASYAIYAMTVMFIIYGAAGGLAAAIVTDFIQGILTIIFSFLLLPFVFSVAADVVGTSTGFEALQAAIAEWERPDMLSLTLSENLAQKMGRELITPFYVIMLSISGLLGIVVQPHIMGVCSAGKTEFEGRFGFTFGNFLKRFCTIAWTFTGLACIAIYLTPGTDYMTPEDVAQFESDPGAFADQVFGRAAHDILPTISLGLVGLLFASLLAAIMSTCDAMMVVGSGLFTENIYKRFFKPQETPMHYLWVGRIAGLIIVVFALLMQTQFQDVIQVLGRYVQALPAFMGVAFWFGITWRRYSPAGVWTSTLVTAASWYLTQTHQPVGGIIDYFPHKVRLWGGENIPAIMLNPTLNEAGEVVNAVMRLPYQMLIYMSAGAVAGVVVSLFTKPTSREKLDHFFRLIRTPVRPGEEVKTPCTLPENPLPAEKGKLIDLPDLEIPRPTVLGLGGVVGAWCVVGVIIWLTQLLANWG